MKLPISVVILTFNEQANISQCLDSVKNWAGEIFVVDSGSTDNTVHLARCYTDKIYTHEFVNYAAQRNWTQQNLPFTCEWVFHLDAGEHVMPELVVSMRQAFVAGVDDTDGFLINRRAIFMGRWIKHGGIYPTYHQRLYRRQKGYCEEREYDQHFKVEGRVVKLQGDIIDEIATDLNSWTISHARWATAEAKEQLRQSHAQVPNSKQVAARLFGSAIERRRWLRQKLYGRVPLFVRPFGYFFVRYFLLLGFLDGIEGFIFHFLQGFWFRFYVDAKIWEAKRQQSLKSV